MLMHTSGNHSGLKIRILRLRKTDFEVANRMALFSRFLLSFLVLVGL